MEELEPEEVFADLRRIQREQDMHPRRVLMTDAVDVPLLPTVLVKMYFRGDARVLTQMHADTLLLNKCYCYQPDTHCVCNRAASFIVRCWFMQADRDEVWRVARRLVEEYRLERSFGDEKKLPFY